MSATRQAVAACVGALIVAGVVARSTVSARARPSAAVAPAMNAPSAAAARAMQRYAAALDRTDEALAAFERVHDLAAGRRALLRARLAYKEIEWLAEHYAPLTAAALNGPAVDRPDEENPAVVVRPSGLQVIESMVYRSPPDARLLDSVAIQARIARVNVRRLRERVGETSVADAQLFDAARVEVARISALGIAGVDAPLAKSAIPEAAVAIRSLGSALAGFAPGSAAADSLQVAVSRTVGYLDAHRRFETFDRFEFITRYANPLAARIGELQTTAEVPRPTDSRVWAASANTLFDRGAIDAAGFAPPGTPRSTPALAALGERLFADPVLSSGAGRSCVTCHDPARAFTDGQRLPALLVVHDSGAGVPPRRNTPTLYNAALQSAAFADARVAFLEDQVAAVVNNPREMGGDLDRTARSLSHDARFRTAFQSAFGAVPAPVEMSRAVRTALAAYLRSLVRLDSRFDRAMRGEKGAMTLGERRGFNLFMGKARCGTCHFAPLFNGTAPPGFTGSEVETVGVPSSRRPGAPLDPDRGVGAIDRAPLHAHAFKTPTVRNAAVTAPYMHNGAFRTLAEVIEFYDHGGGVGSGLVLPNQTLPADSLHLTRAEKEDIAAFLGALTDTGSCRAPSRRPVRRNLDVSSSRLSPGRWRSSAP